MTIQRITGTINGTVNSLQTFLDTNLVTLGWSIAFKNLEKSTYRQGIQPLNIHRSRGYYYVGDGGDGLGGAKEARIYMAENATAHSFTGLQDISPLVTQSVEGLFIRKSFTADTTSRNIILVGNMRSVYIFIQTGDDTTNYSMTFIGDYLPLVKSQNYSNIIIARQVINSGIAGDDRGASLVNSVSSVHTGHYAARNVNGNLKSVPLSKSGDYIKGGTGAFAGTGAIPYPNPTNNMPVFSDMALCSNIDSRPSYIGTMPGLIYFCHNRPHSNNDTFTINSKTYEIFNTFGPGQVCIETSNTWEL